jgi:FlaA1/EpsC-like NDP-sugar epimerase
VRAILNKWSAGSARRDQACFTFSAVLSDIVVWLAATELAALARADFDGDQVPWRWVSVLALSLALGQTALGTLVRLYHSRYQPGSFDEMRALAVSVTAVSVIGTVIVMILEPKYLPRSLPFLAWPLAVVGLSAIRVAKRLLVQAARLPGESAEPILIIGAGRVGSALALHMMRNRDSLYRPVGFLDDDRAKRKLHIHGVPVLGVLADLAVSAQRSGATRVVIAITDVNAKQIRKIFAASAEANLGCLVLPPLSEQLRGSPLQLSALRDVDIEDVIGRRPVQTDLSSMAAYITDRRVLVTGAGGSIGSELCRQLHDFNPRQLVMLDHDESGLHAVELLIHGRALLDSPDSALVDIRDPEALGRIFAEHRPEVVFHAAALKHLPLLERYPDEAFKSNVIGTRNVLEAANRVGTRHFINISTDKAANPASALGHSKRLAERLTAWFAFNGVGEKYISVRFGNVLGSRGSVLHSFGAQIERGGPVTVTDPEVTRYFMTIPEACQLVIQAGAIGRPGEALVLDMGQRVKIVDVARHMIAMSGRAVDVVYTGLRGGEKLHEETLGAGELDVRPSHPLISHVAVPPLRPDLVDEQPWAIAARGRSGLRRSGDLGDLVAVS